MIEIEIDLQKFAAALAKLDPATLNQRTRAALQESISYIEALVVNAIPVNTGNTRQGVFTDVRGQTLASLRGIVASPHKHALVLERGRTPGKRMPPEGPIALWALRKLGVNDAGVVFLIRRAIGRRGLPALKMFENAALKAPPIVEAIFAKHLRAL